MYLHKQFINRLIELTEQGLDWQKDESNSNAWASPNYYKTSLKKFDIHIIFSPNFGNNWTKKHIGNQATNITDSSKRTNIIALIIIDTKNKIQQFLIFNEVDPFDQIGFELFKIIIHYNDPQLEEAYVGYKEDKMKESKILVSNLFEKIKKSS